MIFGIEANKMNPTTIPFEWILNRRDSSVKLTIRHKYKQGILDQLNVNGINRSTLFPEIEYQGRHLIDTYKTS